MLKLMTIGGHRQTSSILELSFNRLKDGKDETGDKACDPSNVISCIEGTI